MRRVIIDKKKDGVSSALLFSDNLSFDAYHKRSNNVKLGKGTTKKYKKKKELISIYKGYLYE